MQPSSASRTVRLKKAFFTIFGTIFLVLGAIGIVVPILPTTPFLLLSAACYLKGSERMYRWLLDNKLFGTCIKNYKDGKGISAKGKIFTLSLLWITILYSGFFLVASAIIQVVLLAVCIGVTIHLVRIPTYRKTTLAIAQKNTDRLNYKKKND
jgi:uncharacterized membrane protein YbaN (DUF454 family)